LLTDSKIFRNNKLSIARLWLHECHRVWKDRLIRDEDVIKYNAYIGAGISTFQLKPDDVHAEPLIFTSFVSLCRGFNEPTLMPVVSMDDLRSVLEDKLQAYNDERESMDLVLFTQAMQHVARIARIIDQPKGHALLVGVGGSGKQSLSKLASYILSYEVFRIVVTSSYGTNELKIDE
jgi:dynein heavy chain, axonemal